MLLNALATQSASPKKANSNEVPVVDTKAKSNLPPTPVATKGCYPCLVRSCNEILPVSRLLNHVRSLHSSFYCEGSIDALKTFTVTLSLPTSNSSPLFKWQKVFFINGIGLVFFTYMLLKSGYLIATAQMAAKQHVAEKFKCILDLKNTRGADYRDIIKLASTREKFENILYGKKCILLCKKQTKSLRQQSTVSCTLEFSPVKRDDVFGSHYTRLETPHLKDILLYYKTHNQNNALPSVFVGFNVVL